jgi:hypothetical protein
VRARQQRSRRQWLIAAGLTVAVVASVAAVAIAAPSKTVAISDRKGDVDGALDIQRAQFGIASDGRLRAVITLAEKVDPGALLTRSGPPGSVCVKIWTAADADPAATAPDRLVCVTARSSDELRASVLRQSRPGSPERVATASVGTNDSRRSLIVRFAQSALGSPGLIRFAVESTRRGCPRVSCVDQVPDDGAVRRFRLR